jgi:formylmethanofuran dehydrogenase subunit E
MQTDLPQIRKKRICSVPIEDFVQRAKDFHGAPAPGVVLGGYMVDLAYRHLPSTGALFDALSETRSCLPDAIQLLTPCTIGNGWLKVLDFGRYALSLYDKHNGSGIRVFVDASKLEPFTEIKAWFFKLKQKDEQPLDVLLDEIYTAGSQVCGVMPVKLKPEVFTHRHRGGFRICPVCGESHPAADGDRCRACSGETPYL